MTDLPALPLIISILVTILAALVQGTIGIGLAVVSVPILSLVDPRFAPVPQLLLCLPLGVWMALRERHAIDFRGTAWILFGRLPGTAVGLLLLQFASPRALDLLIGSMVLFAVFALAGQRVIARTRNKEILVGVASGAMGLVSSMGGPPVALLYRDARGAELRANLAFIFAIGSALSVLGRWSSGQIARLDVEVSVLLLGPMIFGFYLSHRWVRRLEHKPLKPLVLTVVAAAAIGLLFRAAT